MALNRIYRHNEDLVTRQVLAETLLVPFEASSPIRSASSP